MAETSRKETAEKSRIRLWRSTLGTLMLAGSSAFQFIRKGRPLRSVGRSNSSVFMSDSSVVWINISAKPLCWANEWKWDEVFWREQFWVWIILSTLKLVAASRLTLVTWSPFSSNSFLIFLTALFLFLKTLKGLNPTWRNQVLMPHSRHTHSHIENY